jgi:thiol-disulfide isomerase/thioredoxin
MGGLLAGCHHQQQIAYAPAPPAVAPGAAAANYWSQPARAAPVTAGTGGQTIRFGAAAPTKAPAIPALIFFKNGKPVDQIIGAVPKGVLKRKVDSVLSS